MTKLKYIGVYFSPVLALISLNLSGIGAFTAIIVLYIIVPISEQLIPQDKSNFSKKEKELAKHDKFYDWVLYLLVPLHLYVIFLFLNKVSASNVPIIDLIAYTMTMGTILGVNGINGGHELDTKPMSRLRYFALTYCLLQVYKTIL